MRLWRELQRIEVHVIFPVDLSLDYFALFGLPRQFDLDEAALERAWHARQSDVHPDRHAHKSDSERRLSMQQALRVNEAYATLKKPLARARYQLELAGVTADALNGTVTSVEYLSEQLEWREAVGEAKGAGNLEVLEQLAMRLREQKASLTAQLAEQLDRLHDFAAGSDTVRRLMFLDKLHSEIDNALMD